jgi:hypothetical protein
MDGGVESNNVKKKGPLLVFDFDRTITDLNTDTEVSHPIFFLNFFASLDSDLGYILNQSRFETLNSPNENNLK